MLSRRKGIGGAADALLTFCSEWENDRFAMFPDNSWLVDARLCLGAFIQIVDLYFSRVLSSHGVKADDATQAVASLVIQCEYDDFAARSTNPSLSLATYSSARYFARLRDKVITPQRREQVRTLLKRRGTT